ncbi:MAG TPA: trypsin-like serine protease [Mucilaginibacter sp.]|nr:trypsin-like serine protease [Mucilaginibacter sp.]
MKIRVFHGIYVLPILVILFCSGVIRNDIPISKYIALANEPRFDCVGKIISGKDKFSGSCVLISDRYVLTAGHINFNYVDGQIDMNCQFKDKQYKVKRVTVYPGFTKKTYNLDMAVIELAESVNDIKPAILNNNPKEIGHKCIGVGYGVLKIANTSPSPTWASGKLAGENCIDSIGGVPESKSGLASFLIADFDGPGKFKKLNVIGSARPYKLEYGLNGGDSGGGMFIKIDGKWKLAGIVHGVSHMKDPSFYGSLQMWSRVSSFYEWIIQTMHDTDPAIAKS